MNTYREVYAFPPRGHYLQIRWKPKVGNIVRHTYMSLHIYVCTCIYVCIYTYIYACMCACIYILMHVCT